MHCDIRIDGPILLDERDQYVVVTRNRPDDPRGESVSNPATLRLCMGIARETNKRAKQTLAHVRYVGDGTTKVTR